MKKSDLMRTLTKLTRKGNNEPLWFGARMPIARVQPDELAAFRASSYKCNTLAIRVFKA